VTTIACYQKAMTVLSKILTLCVMTTMAFGMDQSRRANQDAKNRLINTLRQNLGKPVNQYRSPSPKIRDDKVPDAPTKDVYSVYDKGNQPGKSSRTLDYTHINN
jgi:hypothetical protein